MKDFTLPIDFLLDKKALLVDPCKYSTEKFTKFLLVMGFQEGNIFDCKGQKEGLKIIQTQDIFIVLCEYHLEDCLTHDFHSAWLEFYGDTSEKIFLVKGTSSIRDVVYDLASLEIDSYLLTPLSFDLFNFVCLELIKTKIIPNAYNKIINQVKKLIRFKNYPSAKSLLNEALELDSHRFETFYYLGKINRSQNDFDSAIENFTRALGRDEKNYKVMRSLFECYIALNLSHKAYEIGKRMMGLFPPSTREIKELIRLSLATMNYKDMLTLSDLVSLVNLDDFILRSYICSGLFVTGKYLLLSEPKETGISYFNKIIFTFPSFSKFVFPIISFLVESGLLEEAGDRKSVV